MTRTHDRQYPAHHQASFSLGQQARAGRCGARHGCCSAASRRRRCGAGGGCCCALFGARVGRGARVYGSTRVWLPANLTLGNGVLIGRRVNLYNQGTIRIGRHTRRLAGRRACAQVRTTSRIPGFPLVTRPIAIGDNVWIAAEAFVGPGVIVGDGAVLGARGVAMRPLDAWGYYAGNPATKTKDRPRLP